MIFPYVIFVLKMKSNVCQPPRAILVNNSAHPLCLPAIRGEHKSGVTRVDTGHQPTSEGGKGGGGELLLHVFAMRYMTWETWMVYPRGHSGRKQPLIYIHSAPYFTILGWMFSFYLFKWRRWLVLYRREARWGLRPWEHKGSVRETNWKP